jgi:Mg-chelatase subunit ChlD
MFGRNKSTASTGKQEPVNPVQVVQDGAGASAVDLDAVKAAGHVSLAKGAATVGVSLRKRNLAGLRGRVVVVLDHSLSMQADYRSGTVQALLLRTLAFGLQINTSALVEVIPFDSRVWSTVSVGLANYESVVRGSIWQPDRMGSTDLTRALNTVRQMAASTKEPIVCIVITDGEPDSQRDATQVVCDMARYPVFLKFLAIRPVAYLRTLDDLEQTQPGARLLDNVDAKTISNPATISDEDFAEAMTDEWDSWLGAAQAAGVLL